MEHKILIETRSEFCYGSNEAASPTCPLVVNCANRHKLHKIANYKNNVGSNRVRGRREQPLYDVLRSVQSTNSLGSVK